jgi:octaprenyl-diphosphate synthase
MDALSRLLDCVADDMTACNRAIVARMDSPVALIPQLAAHLVAAGGKRLRPLLTLACARLCGYPDGGQRHVHLAACVEFIHTATLLHDDVVDESMLRRGAASANAVFGNKASVLVGDFLFARAFQLMVEDGSLRVLEILSGASATIAEGEVLQLATQNDLSTSEDRYLEVVRGKTAALFAAACQVGAVVAGQQGGAESALSEYGMNLGIAFQLVDDALDYVAREERIGKPVGSDFREGKITYPIMHVMRVASPEDRKTLEALTGGSGAGNGDLRLLFELVERYRAVPATMELADDYLALARVQLERLPDSPARRVLHRLVEFVRTRDR